MKAWRTSIGIALVAAAVSSGCSGDSGTFATVAGTVTLDGAPVGGAKVTFHGTTEADGKTDSFATTTDNNGNYVIAGVGKNPGIPPGLYQISITKYDAKGFVASEGMDAGQLEAMMSDQGSKSAGILNLVPREYANPASSNLSARVEAGKNENVNFELKKKPTK
jgi:hypothetical protein